MADLSGVYAKVSRAEEHLRAFDEMYTEFTLSGPYTIFTEFEPKTGWHIVRWHVLREPPLDELGLIFGDMISNLRATLDYLVWQLVLAAGQRPGKRTGFPVVRREKDWEVQSREALRGVDPSWIAEIEYLQPFRLLDQPSHHPLAILDHVNNVNKHRFLPAAVLSVERLDLLINVEDAPGEAIESSDFLDRPIAQGGELARFRVPSKALLDVVVNQAPRTRLSFDDGLGFEWHPPELLDWVKEAVALFEPAFH